MKQLHVQFRGLNTDQCPTRLPSGSSDVCLNVELDDGVLRKRSGVAAITGNLAAAPLAVWQANFASGDIYLVAKCADGRLYQRRMYSSDAGAWTTIDLTNLVYASNLHSTADTGWAFMHADRFHYVDRVGVTKWHPTINSGKAYKGGLPRPKFAPAVAVAAGGQKDGYYHVAVAYRNSKTKEVSVHSLTHTPGVTCSVASNNGGISVTNFAAELNAAGGTNDDVLKYEWDQLYALITMGSTEAIARGSVSKECFSHVYYPDVVNAAAHDGTGTLGMNKADHVLRVAEVWTNAGGEPPGSSVGLFIPDSSRAVYCNVYESSTLVPDKIAFSIAGYPCMVPKEVTYTLGGDSMTITPSPWIGEWLGGMNGAPVAAAYGGGHAAVFTQTATWVMRARGDGRLYPVRIHPSIGCIAPGACVGTPHGVHAISRGCWSLLGADGQWVNFADGRFLTTLDETPVAYQNLTRMGYFAAKDQVWAAVVKTGSTVAQRVIVWDRSENAVLVWDLAHLSAGEGIACMCEMSLPGAEPVMLLFTTSGECYKYPSGTSDAGTNFAAQWRGYWGQEYIGRDQKINSVQIHCGSSVANNVTLGFREFETAGETIDARTETLNKSNALEHVMATLDRTRGRMFQIEFSSTSSVSAQWSINDIVVEIDAE